MNENMPPELSAALVQAQKMAKAVEKDGTNKFHNYKYASAEALIEEGRSVLADAGLAVSQLSIHFVPAAERAEKLPIGRIFITYKLIHTSGQFMAWESSSPVIPEKGRPDDKAEFGAITANLGYTIRGLLLLPREDATTSPNTRDDRDYTPAAAPPKPALPAASPPKPALPVPPATVVSPPAPAAALPAPAVPPPAANWPSAAIADPAAIAVEIQRLINTTTALEGCVPLYEMVKTAAVTKDIKDALFAHLFGAAFKHAVNRKDLEAWAPAVKASGIEGESQAWTRAEWERRYNEMAS